MPHTPSRGVILNVDMAGGTSYATVGQVKDVNGPNIARGEIDVTDHDSEDGYREFLPGLVDGGDVSFDIGFDKTDTAQIGGPGTGLLGDMEQDGCTLPAWKLIMKACSGTAYWLFSGFVNAFGMQNPVEGEQLASIGIKISGKPTFHTT